MGKFKHLKNYEVKDKTAEFPLTQIAGSIVLIMKPATEANKPYFNDKLRNSRRTARQVRTGALDNSSLSRDRNKDRDLFPKHVIVGWKNVVDFEGKKVEFNETNCKDFIDSLPDWIFDEIRIFAMDPQEFIDSEQMEDIAKN